MAQIYRGPIPLGSFSIFFEFNSQEVLTFRFQGVPVSRFLKVGWVGLELPAPTSEGIGLYSWEGKSIYQEPTALEFPSVRLASGFANVRTKFRLAYSDVIVRAD